MLNKIAILLITYKTHEFTKKLVNQIEQYDSSLYDLYTHDNSVNNKGFDQTVINWLNTHKGNYKGYWVLNNDTQLNLEQNYFEKFLEYLNNDEEIALLSTHVHDLSPVKIAQNQEYGEPRLVKYIDFMHAVISNSFLEKINFKNADYFFGGLDFDLSYTASKLNMKLLVDYRYSLTHFAGQSSKVNLPAEDLNNYITGNNINTELNESFHVTNNKLLLSKMLERHEDLKSFDDCGKWKSKYAGYIGDSYKEIEFNEAISLYNNKKFKKAKALFKRAYIAGKMEALDYFSYISNYTQDFEDSELLEKYVDRTTYSTERQKYEYLATQQHYFKKPSSIKEVVFYVKPDAGRAWDAVHTEEGVGGSEIAVINLSQELAKLGYNVTVFNRCHTEGNYNNVQWKHINTFDEYEKSNNIDILVVSRLPEFRFVNPKTKVYFWAHDLNYYNKITPTNWQYFDKFLILSKFHFKFFKTSYPWIPTDRFEILPNGINLDRFNKKIERNNKKLIYSSNPDRGLTFLFDVFEKLYKWDSDLNLHVFGYYPDNVRKHPSYWKDMPGVIYRGYHDQEKLAEEYLSSKLWLYPCTWLETYCITALEAQAAGTPAVVSEWGVLRDRVGNGGIVVDGFLKDKDHLTKFVNAIKLLLTNEELWEKYSRAGIEQVQSQTWTNVAKTFSYIINNGNI